MDIVKKKIAERHKNVLDGTKVIIEQSISMPGFYAPRDSITVTSKIRLFDLCKAFEALNML